MFLQLLLLSESFRLINVKGLLRILQSEKALRLISGLCGLRFLTASRGEEKKMQNKQTEQKRSFSFVFGNPKAYKGTPKGRLRKEVVPFGFCNQPKRLNCR